MFNWLRRKESKTGQVIFTGKKDPSWSKRQYDKAFADEGYSKNVIAYQAIEKTAKAVGAIPWYVKRRDGEEMKDHPLLRLIENPNPLQSRSEYLQALVGFYRISGNAYMERVMVQGKPRELYTLRPDRTKVVPSETGFPRGYVYRVGQNEVKWEADPVTGMSDIRHLKTFNPLDDWYGLSPIEAGAYAVDQHNESMKWIQSLLQNGAAPSGALEMQKGENGFGSLSDDEFNRLKVEIDEKYSGSSNAGRPMLLEGGLKWTQMGLSPQAMGIIETKYSAARDVSLALAVPPLLLNIPGDSTFNNYKEARLAFYEETVIPLAQHIRDELNAWLSPLFDGATLELDLDQVPAIAEKRMEMWAMANESTDLTINERRAMKGYDEVDGGDTILIDSNKVPLEFAMPELPGEGEPSQQLSAKELKALGYGKTD